MDCARKRVAPSRRVRRGYFHRGSDTIQTYYLNKLPIDYYRIYFPEHFLHYISICFGLFLFFYYDCVFYGVNSLQINQDWQR